MDSTGRFDLSWFVMRDPATPSHRFISSATVYSVKVGNNLRSYVISSATMPVKIAP